MTLIQLKHLIALDECGSFSRAADSQCLTQPALSRSVRALEDELGMPLFDRMGRRTELTPFGQEVLARARQLVADADDLLVCGQNMVAGHSGRLRVGLGSGPGAILMTPLLRHMAQHHSGLHFEITRGNTELLIVALRERHLDAVVIDARAMVPARDLKTALLVELRGAFMCRSGHPLAGKVDVTLDELQAYSVASTSLSEELARALVECYGPQAHPDHLFTLKCDEIASLVEVARESDAIVLSVCAAAPELVEIDIRPALPVPARYAFVTLAKHSQTPTLPLLKALIQTMLTRAA